MVNENESIAKAHAHKIRYNANIALKLQFRLQLLGPLTVRLEF